MNDAKKRAGVWIILATLLLAVLGSFYVARNLWVKKDLSALSGGLNQSRFQCEKEIELGLGSIPIQAARLALCLLDLPPEAKAALRSARGVEVGIYHLRARSGAFQPGEVLRAADGPLNRRGWSRIVTVRHDRQTVAVYAADGNGSPSQANFYVLYLEGQRLIAVFARSNLEPLFELAATKFRRARGLELAAAN